jgi:hypothetical protein
MLNDFCRDGYIEVSDVMVGWVAINSELAKHKLRRCRRGEANGIGVRFASYDLVAAPREFAAQCTVTAADVDYAACTKLCTQVEDVTPKVCCGVRRVRCAGVILA